MKTLKKEERSVFQERMAGLVGKRFGVDPAQVRVVENEPEPGIFDVVATWAKDGLFFVAAADFIDSSDQLFGEIRFFSTQLT